jgi:integrase
MSVDRYETADGTRWRVRWREGNGKARARSLTSKEAALALDADIRAKKFTGQALPRAGRESLAVAYEEWWRLRGSQLSSNTQRTYTAVWKAHVQDRFDSHRINELAANPQLFEELLADMRERGVGPASQRKVLVVISAVLTAAVEWNKIATNPVWHMRKPGATRQRNPYPFPPVLIERIRLRMMRRATKDATGIRPQGDACLVSLLAYAGLRPGEALALRFNDIGTRTITVDKAVSDGEEGPTKTGGVRTVPLAGPLHDDIRAWGSLRKAHSQELLFPSRDGAHWSRSEFNNWRNRVWKPVLRSLRSRSDVSHARPYDCRGSFVSLQLRAGASPLEVAAWAGHSPAVMFRHYAGVIQELVGEPIISPDEQITNAREMVHERPADQLDQIVSDVLERPTIAASGGSGAAAELYAPAEAS